ELGAAADAKKPRFGGVSFLARGLLAPYVATKLNKALRREISIAGKPFVVTLSPEGLKVVGKGRRKGLELSWEDLTSGDAALATALNASVAPGLVLEPSAKKRGKHA